MEWKLSKPEPAMLVYHLMKIIGLAPFTVNKNGFYPPTSLGNLYSVFAATIYFVLGVKGFLLMCEILAKSELSKVTETAFIIQCLTSVLVTPLITITFLLSYKKTLYILNKLRMIGNELKNLAIEQDQEEFMKNISVNVLKANALLVAASVAIGLMDRNGHIIHVIGYTMGNWVYINSIIIFGSILIVIRRRFKLLNEKLYDIMGRAAGHRRCHDHSQIVVMSRKPRGENQVAIEDLTDIQSVRRIKALHLELCDLVIRTTQLFAIPILLKTIQSCSELVLNSFWIYYLIRNFNIFSNDTASVILVFDILNSVFKIAAVFLQVSAVAHVSVETCQEGNAMRAGLFKVWYKFEPRKLEDEFLRFSVQLLQQPVTVSAFGLFDLTYSYVHEILCVLVAYVIIMIQFDSS